MSSTRRTFLAGAAAAAAAPRVAWAAPRPPDVPVVTAPPLTDREYLLLADRIMDRLNHTWVRHKQAYSAGTLNVGTIYNAAILTVHATAAEAGHQGRSRNDARARMLVEQLTGAPPFFTGPRGRRGKMYHSPGWLADLDLPKAPQDKSIDPKVAEGLVAAWRAREVLQLAPATIERLTHCVDRVARDSFFRFPNVRLNQINWNAELYAAAATLTGDPELLRRDYRKQLRRFVRDRRDNFGPSYRFHYLPHFPSDDPTNSDSAEYANITLHVLHAYEAALAVGMRPLPAGDIRILRAWVRRALFGYWMHSGMLNWDTGLGIARWMKAKTWAYAQQGLLTIASAPRFHEDARYGGWAKHMFDRGLRLYEGMLVDGDTRAYPSPHLYGATTKHQATGDQRVFSARMAANAARAVVLGLGRMPAPEPPPFFAYDADVGRLAISTPRYATAIVATNRGAFPYGGLEPARLFDGAGQPFNLGGRGNAAFGLVIRGPSGRLATQTADRGELRLDHPWRPGPFRELGATARISGPDAAVVARHRFTETFIETTWTLQRKRAVTVDAQFPSARGTEIQVVFADGRVVTLRPGRAGVKLDGVVRIELGGYAVTLPGLRGGSARALRAAPQATNPRPGPTLAVRIPRTAHTVKARITVR